MGLVLGLVLASGRMASVQSRDNLAVKALKAVAKFFCTAYVEVFRATPMLVQVFIIYYGLGNVFKLPDSSLNRMFWGMVAVGLNSGGLYVGGHPLRHRRGAAGGQMEAARCIGMSHWKCYAPCDPAPGGAQHPARHVQRVRHHHQGDQYPGHGGHCRADVPAPSPSPSRPIFSWSRMSSRPSCILSLCSRCRRSSRLWKGG